MDFLKAAKFAQAVELLDQKQRANLLALPDGELNHKQLLQLGQISRRLGDFSAAAGYFERAAQLGDDPECGYLADLFCGRLARTPRQLDRRWPSPFVYEAQVLSEAEAREFLADAIRSEPGFRQASMLGKNLDTSIRSALCILPPKPWRARLREYILARLPFVMPFLGVAPFEIQEIRFSLLCSRDGDFYLPHRDDDILAEDRRISFVHYLHREPKPYQGGDLLLYDTFSQSGECEYDTSAFTRLIPRHNCGIFFPSDVNHEVTRVKIPAAGFENNRFSIACWVYGSTNTEKAEPAK